MGLRLEKGERWERFERWVAGFFFESCVSRYSESLRSRASVLGFIVFGGTGKRWAYGKKGTGTTCLRPVTAAG